MELGESFTAIGKEIKLKYGDDLTCVTPALDKVLAIAGSQETLNVKHIARLLSITSGAATQHIDALEKIGAVSRIPNEKDRREIIIQLTPKGESMYQKIQDNHVTLLEEVFEGLEDSELEELVRLITKASTKYC